MVKASFDSIVLNILFFFIKAVNCRTLNEDIVVFTGECSWSRY